MKLERGHLLIFVFLTGMMLCSSSVFASQTISPFDTTFTSSILVNGGASFANSTTVKITLVTSDTLGISNMSFSNDNNNWSSWQAYANDTTWTLPSGDGAKTVYAQYNDTSGNSIVVSASTTLDTTPPTVYAGGVRADKYTVDFNALNSWDLNGIKSYSWNFGDGNTSTGGNVTHTYADYGTYPVSINVTDYAGNVTPYGFYVYLLEQSSTPASSPTPTPASTATPTPSGQPTTQPTETPTTSEGGQNLLLFTGVIVIVVVVAAAGVILLRKKM
jgi:PKD repeat protein